MSDGMPIRHTWTESDRRVPRLIARPLRRALRHDAAGGVVMLVAALTAVANSPWSDSYFDLWGTLLRVELGDVIHPDHLSLQAWVNDALMTIFFSARTSRTRVSLCRVIPCVVSSTTA